MLHCRQVHSFTTRTWTVLGTSESCPSIWQCVVSDSTPKCPRQQRHLVLVENSKTSSVAMTAVLWSSGRSIDVHPPRHLPTSTMTFVHFPPKTRGWISSVRMRGFRRQKGSTWLVLPFEWALPAGTWRVGLAWGSTMVVSSISSCDRWCDTSRPIRSSLREPSCLAGFTCRVGFAIASRRIVCMWKKTKTTPARQRKSDSRQIISFFNWIFNSINVDEENSLKTSLKKFLRRLKNGVKTKYGFLCFFFWPVPLLLCCPVRTSTYEQPPGACFASLRVLPDFWRAREIPTSPAGVPLCSMLINGRTAGPRNARPHARRPRFCQQIRLSSSPWQRSLRSQSRERFGKALVTPCQRETWAPSADRAIFDYARQAWSGTRAMSPRRSCHAPRDQFQQVVRMKRSSFSNTDVSSNSLCRWRIVSPCKSVGLSTERAVFNAQIRDKKIVARQGQVEKWFQRVTSTFTLFPSFKMCSLVVWTLDAVQVIVGWAWAKLFSGGRLQSIPINADQQSWSKGMSPDLGGWHEPKLSSYWRFKHRRWLSIDSKMQTRVHVCAACES